MRTLVTSLKDSVKRKTPAASGVASTAETGTRVTKLTKPVKVPTWSKSMYLETFAKQLQRQTEINKEIPEFIKYNHLMESLKSNKDIKDLPRYIGEHVLLVLEKKQENMIKKVLELLEVKYGRSRTEKIEECVEDILKFKEDQYEENEELILAMKEIWQRQKELKITQDE